MPKSGRVWVSRKRDTISIAAANRLLELPVTSQKEDSAVERMLSARKRIGASRSSCIW